MNGTTEKKNKKNQDHSEINETNMKELIKQ